MCLKVPTVSVNYQAVFGTCHANYILAFRFNLKATYYKKQLHFNITRKTLIVTTRMLELSGQEESREPGMMSPAWKLTVEVATLGDCIFKASMVCRVSSSAARDTQRTLVFKTK